MQNPRYDVSTPPPGSWRPARKFALRVVGPIERFVHVEASSGIVLVVAAIIAMAWANSPFGESYDELWHTPFTIGLGEWVFERSLHFWINDFLMAVFFFVVGLEIKRELVEGALSDLKRAALPVAAALGGMILPATIFLAFNWGGPGVRGWGVPMATDIAFAVGVLTLLGSRVPAGLRILLLAVAIIDDIGAILVIAFFYSSGIQPEAFVIVGTGFLGILTLNWIGIRPGLLWTIPPLILWAGIYQLGVHPTIAGVIVGLMTPVRSWFGRDRFLEVARAALDDFQHRANSDDYGDDDLVEPLNMLAQARREALSPAKRLENVLHPWVAFLIMPVFALANAGVNLAGINFGDVGAVAVLSGVVIGLFAGKTLGIFGFSWLAVRVGLGILPQGVTWRGLVVVGATGGIGFTMAIFIAELAYSGAQLLVVAKLGVIIATILAGVAALLGGLVLLPKRSAETIRAITDSQFESSPEFWTTGPGVEAEASAAGE